MDQSLDSPRRKFSLEDIRFNLRGLVDPLEVTAIYIPNNTQFTHYGGKTTLENRDMAIEGLVKKLFRSEIRSS